MVKHSLARLQHSFDMEGIAFEQVREDLRATGGGEPSLLSGFGLLLGLFSLAAVTIAALPHTGAFQ